MNDRTMQTWQLRANFYNIAKNVSFWLPMEILLKTDVMNRLKISEATLYRWISESRSGIGNFPLPVSQPKRTLRWNSDDIDRWCSRKQVEPMVKRSKHTKADKKRDANALQKVNAKYKIF